MQSITKYIQIPFITVSSNSINIMYNRSSSVKDRTPKNSHSQIILVSQSASKINISSNKSFSVFNSQGHLSCHGSMEFKEITGAMRSQLGLPNSGAMTVK